MKPAQWMAVVILASMVGGITFVMVYLGGSRGSAAKVIAPQASLTFASKRYPEEGAKALTSEINQLAHQDFWFHNDSGHEVAVGLNSKSCKCTDVELSIAPEEWRPRLLAAVAARALSECAEDTGRPADDDGDLPEHAPCPRSCQ